MLRLPDPAREVAGAHLEALRCRMRVATSNLVADELRHFIGWRNTRLLRRSHRSLPALNRIKFHSRGISQATIPGLKIGGKLCYVKLNCWVGISADLVGLHKTVPAFAGFCSRSTRSSTTDRRDGHCWAGRGQVPPRDAARAAATPLSGARKKGFLRKSPAAIRPGSAA